MLTLTAGKKAAMDRLSTQEGIISALAIDQRGALKKMIKALDVEPTDAQIETFKELVSKELTPYASAILLDPEYGLPAAKAVVIIAGIKVVVALIKEAVIVIGIDKASVRGVDKIALIQTVERRIAGETGYRFEWLLNNVHNFLRLRVMEHAGEHVGDHHTACHTGSRL